MSQHCYSLPGDLQVCVVHRGSSSAWLPRGVPAVHPLSGAVLGRPQLRRGLSHLGLCGGDEGGGPGSSRGLECGVQPMHEHLPAGAIRTGAPGFVPLPRQGLQLFRRQ